ncbi:MAM domain-containing glycosylphosphatidylinositol anchor protein 1 [Nymphon striatum]|nr:MAM domain-containing glycosylphosphatidylinositol anchor protein 1 [Nymphon striatum]
MTFFLGHFLYASHSLPPRETVRFVSDLFKDQSVALCLTFYFQMIGSDIGHLQVLINSGTEISTSWILFNYNEKKWTKATVPIKVLNSYSIIFEAVRGNGDYGSIAIDDISIGSDQCSITPHSAAPDLSGKRYCILE